MPDKINSHICLMLSVYNSLHQMVKYGCQRNHKLQDITGLETKISMKTNKTGKRFVVENRFSKKSGINIPNWNIHYHLENDNDYSRRLN